MSSFTQPFAVRAGLNLSFMSTLETALPRFHTGVIAEIPLGPKVKWLSFNSGLIIKIKAQEVVNTYSTHNMSQPNYIVYDTTKTNLTYLDIPLNVNMSFPVRKTKLFFELGCHLGTGLTGTENGRKVEWGNSSLHDYRRFDFGISVGIGIIIKPIRVGLFAESGIPGMGPTPLGTWNGFSLYVDYIFQCKNKSHPSRN
jgi:hypothetical protein